MKKPLKIKTIVLPEDEFNQRCHELMDQYVADPSREHREALAELLMDQTTSMHYADEYRHTGRIDRDDIRDRAVLAFLGMVKTDRSSITDPQKCLMRMVASCGRNAFVSDMRKVHGVKKQRHFYGLEIFHPASEFYAFEPSVENEPSEAQLEPLCGKAVFSPEELKEVNKALGRMSESQRMLLEQFLFGEEKKYQTMAKDLCISLGTLKSRLSTAKRALLTSMEYVSDPDVREGILGKLQAAGRIDVRNFGIDLPRNWVNQVYKGFDCVPPSPSFLG